jgi:hypothetical protein
VLQILDNLGLLAMCSYNGVVVAKLPFEPWPFFQKITHRGLSGSNSTDAALVRGFAFYNMSLHHVTKHID